MANEKKNTKKKGLGIGWLVFIVMILLGNVMENVDSTDFRHLIFRLRILAYRLGIPFEVLPVAAIALVVLVILLISAAVKKGREKRADSPSGNGRTSAAVQRRDPRAKSFTEPEAYCFSCEASGEDHFQRDKQTRIKQLDEWLKNGLIDREEYKVLKSRFERDL